MSLTRLFSWTPISSLARGVHLTSQYYVQLWFMSQELGHKWKMSLFWNLGLTSGHSTWAPTQRWASPAPFYFEGTFDQNIQYLRAEPSSFCPFFIYFWTMNGRSRNTTTALLQANFDSISGFPKPCLEKVIETRTGSVHILVFLQWFKFLKSPFSSPEALWLPSSFLCISSRECSASVIKSM